MQGPIEIGPGTFNGQTGLEPATPNLGKVVLYQLSHVMWWAIQDLNL